MSDPVTEIRRKRMWTVTDFATFMGITPRQARAMLKRLDAETGGMLLLKSGGKKPEYTFFPATLAKVKPEAFERMETLDARISTVEAQLESLRREQRMIVAQTGQNSRDISRIRAKDRAA